MIADDELKIRIYIGAYDEKSRKIDNKFLKKIYTTNFKCCIIYVGFLFTKSYIYVNGVKKL